MMVSTFTPKQGVSLQLHPSLFSLIVKKEPRYRLKVAVSLHVLV